MQKFQGKRVLITGGAQGLGRKLAERFAARGSDLVLTDIQEEKLADTGEALRKNGTTVHTFPLDVTDDAAILEVRDEVHEQAGRIDVLINNAGIVHGGDFLTVPLEKHAFTYRVNVHGVVAMTHAFLQDLIDGDDSHLVNIASASALLGLPYGSTYASSKWAVLGFSESIRLEMQQLRHDHVHVTAVCPSYINTGMFHGVQVPGLTRMLDPDEIADQVMEAIDADRAKLLSPAIVKLIPWMSTLLPQRWVDALNWKLGVSSSMRSWKGHREPPAAPPDEQKSA